MPFLIKTGDNRLQHSLLTVDFTLTHSLRISFISWWNIGFHKPKNIRQLLTPILETWNKLWCRNCSKMYIAIRQRIDTISSTLFKCQNYLISKYRNSYFYYVSMNWNEIKCKTYYSDLYQLTKHCYFMVIETLKIIVFNNLWKHLFHPGSLM